MLARNSTTKTSLEQNTFRNLQWLEQQYQNIDIATIVLKYKKVQFQVNFFYCNWCSSSSFYTIVAFPPNY